MKNIKRIRPAIEELAELVMVSDVGYTLFCLLPPSPTPDKSYERTSSTRLIAHGKTESILQQYPIEFETPLTNIERPSLESRKQTFDWQHRDSGSDQGQLIEMPKQDVSSKTDFSKQTDSVFSQSINRSVAGTNNSAILSQLVPSTFTNTPINLNQQPKEDVRLENLVPRTKTKADAAKAEVSEFAAPGNIKQYIPLNSDNDNNSGMVLFTPTGGGQGVPQHIPQTYDFQTSNYGNDDDLIPLNIQWTNVPPDMALLGYQSYSIVLISNAPGGDISGVKLWKDEAKTVQLPVNVGYTTTGMNIWPGKGYGTLPGFYLEGTKVGKQVDEYSITVLTKVVASGVNVLISREIDVTVTPVIHSFSNTALLDPDFYESSEDGYTHFGAAITWKVVATTDYDFDNSGGSFDIAFVQHLKSTEDLLPGNMMAYKSPTVGIRQYIKPNIGPNANYWFVDSLPEYSGLYPMEIDSDGPQLDRQHTYTAGDAPGNAVKYPDGNWMITDLHHRDIFRFEVVWHFKQPLDCYTEQQDIIYPIGWVDWQVEFHIQNYEIGGGNATSIACAFVEDYLPQFPYVPEYANLAFGKVNVQR